MADLRERATLRRAARSVAYIRPNAADRIEAINLLPTDRRPAAMSP